MFRLHFCFPHHLHQPIHLRQSSHLIPSLAWLSLTAILHHLLLDSARRPRLQRRIEGLSRVDVVLHRRRRQMTIIVTDPRKARRSVVVHPVRHQDPRLRQVLQPLADLASMIVNVEVSWSGSNQVHLETFSDIFSLPTTLETAFSIKLQDCVLFKFFI